ncbi:hypothetical protein VP01_1439g1 [Puccinia sorghi]|uniref:Uncharacterized protein n=1 Tax=Puccinia sorghi TaxID=27349 RepID=A0A0L6VK86_9BASI|nr:hypothetical protein VP01_1439g1 [Puccinia sorghi]
MMLAPQQPTLKDIKKSKMLNLEAVQVQVMLSPHLWSSSRYSVIYYIEGLEILSRDLELINPNSRKMRMKKNEENENGKKNEKMKKEKTMIFLVNYTLVFEVIGIIYMYNNIYFSFPKKYYPLNVTNYLCFHSTLQLIYLVQFSNHATAKHSIFGFVMCCEKNNIWKFPLVEMLEPLVQNLIGLNMVKLKDLFYDLKIFCTPDDRWHEATESIQLSSLISLVIFQHDTKYYHTQKLNPQHQTCFLLDFLIKISIFYKLLISSSLIHEFSTAFRDTSDCFLLLFMSTFHILSEIFQKKNDLWHFPGSSRNIYVNGMNYMPTVSVADTTAMLQVSVADTQVTLQVSVADKKGYTTGKPSFLINNAATKLLPEIRLA